MSIEPEDVTRGILHRLEQIRVIDAFVRGQLTSVTNGLGEPVKPEEAIAKLSGRTKILAARVEKLAHQYPRSFKHPPDSTSVIALHLTKRDLAPFLNAQCADFEVYRAGYLKYIPGIREVFVPRGHSTNFSRLRIGGHVGAFTDEPTREAIELLFTAYPDVLDYYQLETTFYFFRDKIAKTIEIPNTLPDSRFEIDPIPQSNVKEVPSQIRQGDLALVHLTLLGIRRLLETPLPA